MAVPNGLTLLTTIYVYLRNQVFSLGTAPTGIFGLPQATIISTPAPDVLVCRIKIFKDADGNVVWTSEITSPSVSLITSSPAKPTDPFLAPLGTFPAAGSTNPVSPSTPPMPSALSGITMSRPAGLGDQDIYVTCNNNPSDLSTGSQLTIADDDGTPVTFFPTSITVTNMPVQLGGNSVPVIKLGLPAPLDRAVSQNLNVT